MSDRISIRRHTYLYLVPLESRPFVPRCQFPYRVRSRWCPLLSAPEEEAGAPEAARVSRGCQVDTRHLRGASARCIDSGRINPEWENRNATRDPRDDSERARNTLRRALPLQIRLVSLDSRNIYAHHESISHSVYQTSSGAIKLFILYRVVGYN